MAIPKRHALPPGTYFVTSRTWESRPLFSKEPLAQVFMATLLHYRDEGAYRLHAFVLMPDHFHVLLTPAPDKALERVVQYIKGGSAHRVGKELNFTLPVWQRGFSDHRIRDTADYESHLQYVDHNPVKRGLVANPRDYPWSSASGRFAMDDPPQRLKPPGVTATARRHG